MSLASRQALEGAWLALTRETLPALACERRWPIRVDHCFQRVLLDNAAGRCWYEVIERRPAYAHADSALLAEAVRLGEAVVSGEADLFALNDRSLAWRGKLSARARGVPPRG